jgi:hypothetical protein
MILAMNSAGLVELGIVYLELDPVFYCYLNLDPLTQVVCDREAICTGDTVKSWEVNYSDMFTLNNWII